MTTIYRDVYAAVAACENPTNPVLVRVELGHPSLIDEIAVHLTTRGFDVVMLPGERITNEDAAFLALAMAWRFPGYFGYNWNALNDCLRDLSWLSASGYVCILVNAHAMQHLDEDTYENLLGVFDFAYNERWKPDRIPFKLVLA